MVAGGLTIAAPSFMPETEAQSERLMYVSAESEEFGNTIGGGMVTEIIIADPTRANVNDRQGEPTVEINGDVIRFAQGNDGFWYAYIADSTVVAAMDTAPHSFTDYGVLETSGANDPGLSQECIGCDVVTTYGAAVYYGASIVRGEPILSSFNTTDSAGTMVPTSNTDDGLYVGQINTTTADWPFIQVFDMTEGEQEIVFEKPGADEVVVLDFDTPGDFASFSLDRNEGPIGAEIHMEIRDNQLNMDPTTKDTWVFRTGTAGSYGASYNASFTLGTGYYYNIVNSTNGFDDNGQLIVTLDANNVGTNVLAYDITLDDSTADEYMTFWESAPNSGVFSATDDKDDSLIGVSTSALRGTTALFDYNDSSESYTVATYGGSIDMVESDAGDEWNSGEEISIILIDGDLNLNTAADDDQLVNNMTTVPTFIVGTPLYMDLNPVADTPASGKQSGNGLNFTTVIDGTTKIATLTQNQSSVWQDHWRVISGHTHTAINAMNTSAYDTRVVSWDVSALCVDGTIDVGGLLSQSNKGSAVMPSALTDNGDALALNNADTVMMMEDLRCNVVGNNGIGATYYVTLDFMAFGANDHDGIYRVEVEETGNDTGVFEGNVEYIMLNQLTYDHGRIGGGAVDAGGMDVYFNITTIGDGVDIILKADSTGTDAPRVVYPDIDADGVATPIADQVDAPTHSGTVDFDQDAYKTADTVTITVTDMDLNVDSSLVDTYITRADDLVGDNDSIGDHVLDVYISDDLWDDTCNATYGLTASGFQLTETGTATGIFQGTFQIPEKYCAGSSDVATPTTGEDMFVNYNDYLDAGGNAIEVGDAATIAANSGSVSLDRSVYPVPFTSAQYKAHDDIMLSEGNITLYVQVNDADLDTSPTGIDTLAAGSVWITGHRGSDSATLESSFALTEISASAGIFEYEFMLETTDTISSTALKQGDVITANYNDTTDATGNPYLATDSSTLDMRTGSLLSDKSVYVIGSDAIITLVEPDLNFDSDGVESYSLGLVEWDSDAATVNLNNGCPSACIFDPEPSKFRETGGDTGIFQTVIEIPTAISSTNLDRGEKIDLEYVDYGPSGEANVDDSTEDIELNIYTSNFGATIELDSKVYTWTDRVFVTIVAPDHNTDSALIDEIGGATDKSLTAQTRDNKLTAYKLVENGPDTGIFIGEITLTGFTHDADGDATDDGPTNTFDAAKAGPTDGYLGATESDGITVSFEYTEDATVVSSSLIRWNVGEASFSEDAYLSSSSAVVSILDPDMNLNPDTVENFKVDVYSDSDSGGIQLTVGETNESTGVFEGTVFFTTTDASSGHTLRVSEGDSITVDYTDHTLPEPYSTSDDIDVSATAVIGTSTPPLERAPVANARVVDAFGNSLAEVSVDQQVQIEADLVNGQDGDQSFAYLVQVQNSDGVTVSLAWITGQLAAGQSFSPALSWIPDASGSYEATVFVWESVDNPTALSDTTSVNITVV
jgi:hypothetical protein